MRPCNYALVLCALVLVAFAAAASASTLYTATINGAGECPPTSSIATGSGTFQLNDTQDSLSYNITFSGLSATETGAHIHKRVAPDCNGAVRFPLALGSPKTGTVVLTADDLLALQEGRLYTNIHSTNFTGGEIRGDLVLAQVPTKPSTWGRVKALYK